MFVICSLNGFVLQVELQVELELVFLWADSCLRCSSILEVQVLG